MCAETIKMVSKCTKKCDSIKKGNRLGRVQCVNNNSLAAIAVYIYIYMRLQVEWCMLICTLDTSIADNIADIFIHPRELFESWCTDKKNGCIVAGYCVEVPYSIVLIIIYMLYICNP